MKSIFNFFVTAFAALLIFSSCEKVIIVSGNNPVPYPYYAYNIPQNEDGEYGIVFNGYNPATKTKASVVSTSGNGYDTFNLFAWNSNGTVIMNPYVVEATGANAYDYTQAPNQELQYFSNSASNYSFVGVLPISKTASLSNGVVTVKDVTAAVVDDGRVNGTITADSDEEFLYTYVNVPKAQYGSQVTLPFEHGNALLYLGFKSDRNDTELLNYVPGKPEVPEVPATTTTSTKTGKALDMLYNGEIVYWPYASDANLTSTQANNFYKNSSNYGNMGALMGVVNAQFVYYNTSGTITTNAWPEGNKKDMYGVQLAATTNKDDFVGGATEDTWKDAFWSNASTQIKDVFRKSYSEGWRVIRIENISGTQYDAWLMNNTEMTYKVITTTPGTPYQPAVPGIDGIRVFSASYSTNYDHEAHTTVADAAISATGLAYTSTASSTDVINFSLPATTTLSSTAVFSPTTFYAIPCDADVTHFVVKLSYTYNGVTVYDARIPIALPASGLVPGKYYKYTINITSTSNGTNDPGDATTGKDDIEVNSNPAINVQVVDNDYSEGADQVITI